MVCLPVVAAELAELAEPDPFRDDRVPVCDFQAAARAEAAEPQRPAIPVEILFSRLTGHHSSSRSLLAEAAVHATAPAADQVAGWVGVPSPVAQRLDLPRCHGRR